MTPEQRQELETRAERCVRRGELSEAIGLYQSLRDVIGPDPALERKLSDLQESLQPAERERGKGPVHEAGPEDLSTVELEAERLVYQGDTTGAIALYRRALAARPDSELLQERLAELFRSLPPHARSPLAPGEGMLTALLERISTRRR